MSKPLRAVHRAALSLLSGALLALGLAACGSSSGPSGSTMGPQGCTATTCGSALLTLTDANGDFTSYTVDVSSLQLTKADGAVVETLPVKTRIDFAQLVNVTEFLTAATVPNGDYVAATMTVDYSHAAVYVEVNGSSQLATLVDGSGAPLATLQLTVQLDNAHHLVVAPGHPARLALDFNLAASNTVDLSHSPPLVTVKPFIVASLVPADAHELRVRGTLISVDTSGSYTVNVEPFEDSGANHGSVVVHTTPQTTFEIDGTAYTGAPGLAALATLPTGAWTVAFGALDESTETFTASRVLAGSSVEHPGLARLHGTVIARSLDTLTLRGGHLQAEGGGDDRFTPQDVTLRIGSATTVTEVDHPVTAPTIAAISVGSHITAFGTAGTDAGGKSTFDASTGHVRLEFTRLWGLLGTANPGQISVNLQAIDGQPVSVFNFAGTGVNPASDSKPANYQVLTGALPVTGLAPATPVALIGFVEPFNMAPPDFTARTLIDFATVSAELEVSFEPGTLMPFTMIDATGFVINLARPPPGSAHFIRVGPQLIDLTQLAASPRIVPDATGPDEFAIADAPATMMHGTIRTFSAYADFEMALVSALNGTNRVQLVESVGQYDQALNIFTARRIAVVLSH